MIQGVTLLYIDDDAAIGRLVQKALAREGCSVEVAADADAGIARLARGGVDVVALDHFMPGRDGLDALGAIRAMPDPPPVIYVTAGADSRVAVAALKAGAADYVGKDIGGDFIELLRAAMVASLAQIRLRRAKDEAEAEVRASRDRFAALAAEREVLLREVNHRVGNSLQLVAAFLHLQSSSAASAETRSALAEANRRVLAVGQVHRRLYTSPNVNAVALDQYLSALIDDLRASNEADAVGDQISVDCHPVEIDPDSAVAVGVIVTELVINAFKYAYPDGDGPIRVALRRGAGLDLTLSVEDDGVGKAATPKANATGLGRTIIQAMATKLGARVEYAPRDQGTRALLLFSASPPGLAA